MDGSDLSNITHLFYGGPFGPKFFGKILHRKKIISIRKNNVASENIDFRFGKTLRLGKDLD